MNLIYTGKNEKLMKLLEEKKDNLLNNKKNYLYYIILFILIICLTFFLIFILRVKELDIKKQLNIFKARYFSPDNNLSSKNCSISNCEKYKENKNNNYCGKKNYSIKSFATDDKCLKRDNKTNKCLNCDKDYYLVNGECKPYSFMATYHSKNKDKAILLINEDYYPYIIGLYMNNSEIKITYSYIFSFIGNLTFYFYINTSALITIRKSMNKMFKNCDDLVSINFTNFDTSGVTNMNSMFYGCGSLISINLSNFNTSSVTDMGSMFYFCSSLISLNLYNFNTSKVTNMENMFYYDRSLISLNLSNFNTSNVKTMEDIFYYCDSLISINLYNFDTSSVKNMHSMFYGCSSL